VDPPAIFIRFRRQHGLITRAQALRDGLTARQIERRTTSGRWLRVGRGLYRSALVPMTFEQRCLAACLLAGPHAVTSHLSAAVLHGLSGARPGRTEITVANDGHHRSPLAVVHRARSLDRVDRVLVRGIPATGIARTLVDVAARLSTPAFEAMLDDTMCRGAATPDRVRAALGRATQRPGRPGQAALLSALEVWAPGPKPGSAGEMRFARRLVQEGFPPPERQIEIFDASGRRVAIVDFGYRERRVVIEYHGLDGHGPRRALADRARENAIVAAGWTLVVATAADVRPGPSPALDALARLGVERRTPPRWRALPA
jgi:hypothetical protein